MKGNNFFTFFNRIILYGYFAGLFNLIVCLSPYVLLDWMLVLPALIPFIIPLGSFVGIIPYGFFRWNCPISYQAMFGYDSLFLYYLFLILAINLQIYIASQILRGRIYKIYKTIILHHFGVGLFYLINFDVFPLITHEIQALGALLGAYGFLLNVLAVLSLSNLRVVNDYERE